MRICIFLIGSLFGCAFWATAAEHSSPQTQEHLRVLVANINFENRKPTQASKALLQHNANLLFISEWTGRNLNRTLLSEAGYAPILDEPRHGTHGMAIFQRSLHAQATLIESPVPGPCRIPMTTLRLFLGQHPYSFIGIHAPPPVPTCKNTTKPTIEALCDLAKDGRLKKDFGTARQADPVWVVGDLNTLRLDRSMRCFSDSGLTDYHERASASTWAPFTWLPALLKIDYIWGPRRFKTVPGDTFALPGSDHRGLAADIEYPGGTPSK